MTMLLTRERSILRCVADIRMIGQPKRRVNKSSRNMKVVSHNMRMCARCASRASGRRPWNGGTVTPGMNLAMPNGLRFAQGQRGSGVVMADRRPCSARSKGGDRSAQRRRCRAHAGAGRRSRAGLRPWEGGAWWCVRAAMPGTLRGRCGHRPAPLKALTDGGGERDTADPRPPHAPDQIGDPCDGLLRGQPVQPDVGDAVAS